MYVVYNLILVACHAVELKTLTGRWISPDKSAPRSQDEKHTLSHSTKGGAADNITHSSNSASDSLFPNELAPKCPCD